MPKRKRQNVPYPLYMVGRKLETHENQYYNLTKNVFDNLLVCAIT